ncbi:hypothetical protein BLA29_013660 [Euroglyphus maynei]|nr:hypothetical protein BLA29_013660 [Euroglyphus maynei]
MYTNMW